MRYLALLPLALALAACDNVVESAPASSTVRYLFWGPSNAGILANQGDAPLNATFRASGRHAEAEDTATWGGRGLMPQHDDGAFCGDFSPRSEGECYEAAVEHTRRALAGADGSYTVGGVVWHNGTDQNGIDSLYTQEEYDAEFRALIRAAARDLPGLPFYVIQAGTNYTEEKDGANALYTRRFREHEAAVCASEPSCRVISAMTDEVLEEAEDVCGGDALCVDANYFAKGEVHWQHRSTEIIMEEAGRTLARIEG